ncbi:hypothetical protein [Lysinibacillus fusiformis]
MIKRERIMTGMRVNVRKVLVDLENKKPQRLHTLQLELVYAL